MISKWLEKTLEDMIKEEKRLKKALDDIFTVDSRSRESIKEYLKMSTVERMKKMQELQDEIVTLQIDIGKMNNYVFMEKYHGR